MVNHLRIVTDNVVPIGHLKMYDNDGNELPLHGVQDIDVHLPVVGLAQAMIHSLRRSTYTLTARSSENGLPRTAPTRTFQTKSSASTCTT